MSFLGHNPHLFRWKKQSQKDTTLVKNDDIDHLRKRVEMASEFAVSEVFSIKKPHSEVRTKAVSLQSSDQLKDHDDAYSEAQALLEDWLGSKLQLELEMEDDDDLMCTTKRTSPAAEGRAHSPQLNYGNFNELYNHLASEEEHSAVNSVLQDLMEHQVLDSVMVEKWALDAQQTRIKYRNPMVTMEARHQQVRVNKAQRDAVRLRQQREKEAQREARQEARKQEREEEVRKRQEEHRQDELLQKEMVRLRRQMKEKRELEQLARQREKEEAEAQRAAETIHSALIPLKQLQPNQRLLPEQKVQSMIHMSNLRCLQRHFSRWYSTVLDLRLRMGKAKALCDWRRMLRAWRRWQALVWMGQKQRQLARTEEELRSENRQYQLATESDRRRLLRRCLSQWHLWCRTEKEQRELLAQQQETRRKMAALISAASSGKLAATESRANQLIMVQSEAMKKPESTEKKDLHLQIDSAPTASTVHANKKSQLPVARLLQPWQVTRHDLAPTAAELHTVQHKVKDEGLTGPKSSVVSSNRFENRYAVQQQRTLLKEQQEQIVHLKEEQSVGGVKQPRKQRSCSLDSRKQRASGVTGESDSKRAHSSKAATQHPIIAAMEARARQRAERRKEIEELKRKKAEEKLAEMKASEEQRLKQGEEEKLRAAERRREEKRLEWEREEDRQRRLKRQREVTKVAHQHYHQTLLLQRGLVPWKRLLQLKCASIELAENHHRLSLLRRCTRGWQQSVRESVCEKEASAGQLYQRFLLQRSLKCWKRLKDLRLIQEERAKCFSRTHTLRRFLQALLDHVTQERLLERDRQKMADGHNNRRVLQRFFLAWRQLPSQLHIEREKSKRREKLSRKVAEVLPDFFSNNPS